MCLFVPGSKQTIVLAFGFQTLQFLLFENSQLLSENCYVLILFSNGRTMILGFPVMLYPDENIAPYLPIFCSGPKQTIGFYFAFLFWYMVICNLGCTSLGYVTICL